MSFKILTDHAILEINGEKRNGSENQGHYLHCL